jgi:hypothetical protein
MYALWWECGGGGRYHNPDLSHQDKKPISVSVDTVFLTVIGAMSRQILNTVYKMAADEAENAEDPIYASQASVIKWCRENGMKHLVHGDTFKAPTFLDIKNGSPWLSDMASFFTADFWGGPGCGWDFEVPYDAAGLGWARLCKEATLLMDYASEVVTDTGRIAKKIDRMLCFPNAEVRNAFSNPSIRENWINRETRANLVGVATYQDLAAISSLFVQRMIKETQPTLSPVDAWVTMHRSPHGN